MKIAIFFCGSIRDFSYCYPSLKKYLLDNLNPDIFLHLWKMDDIKKSNCNIKFKWRNDSCNEKYVIEKLKPIKYVIDTYNNIWEKKILDESGIILNNLKDVKSKNYTINACGMYYKILQGFNLVKEYSENNNIKYDIIIRARLDFIWEDHIVLSDFINGNVNNNTIFLIKDRYATLSKLRNNDKFFGGDFEVMKKMCSLFYHIKTYQNTNRLLEGQFLNEIHIRKNNFDIKWIGHMYTYYKCLSRHIIKNNNKSLIIYYEENIENICFELSYYFLYKSYYVYCNGNINEKYKNILNSFSNFQKNNNNSSSTLVISSKYIEEYNNYFQIILNLISSSNQRILNQYKNSIIINYTNNIKILDIKDFISSFILSKNYCSNNFYFNNTNIIYDIKKNENIIYRYLDHGFYDAYIINYTKRNNEYTIKFNNIIKKDKNRKNIKILNLLKYIDNKLPNMMPVNYN